MSDQVIVVEGIKGGVGATTVAVLLAQALGANQPNTDDARRARGELLDTPVCTDEIAGEHLVIDNGVHVIDHMPPEVMVIDNSYASLSRFTNAERIGRPVVVVLVQDDRRSLTVSDVRSIIGDQHVVVAPWSDNIARQSDCGALSHRTTPEWIEEVAQAMREEVLVTEDGSAFLA